MGGGGAMRAAAKVAGFGVLNGGLRGIVPDHPASTAMRKVLRPVTGLASPSAPENVKEAAVAIDVSPVQKPCWEFDDWELAGGEEDLFGGSGVSTPRLVFGGAPSIAEAKEATYELKEALEKVYLSAPSTPKTGLSGLSRSEVPETKACVTSETILAPAPKHAIQAFTFLNESPAVQSVVASIASDPNVWNAVLLNPTLQDYIQSQKMGAPSSTTDQYEKGSTADSDIPSPRSPRSVSSDRAESEYGESNSTGRFMELWQELKLTVVDMMNSLSDYFQALFGGYSNNKGAADTNGNVFSGFVDKALGPSLMGLAVMVIVVVVLKRAK
ncbi:unnamed protein product [Coffea canephora]|uniref:Uncharacterized protein n=1 Tax=Coffea canephora TaxID=49390 RepID=A0A068UBI0_COFCA|nr:unnamed protein product [Coffea canephora]